MDLAETWANKFGTADVISMQCVLSVSFSYSRAFGPRSVSGDVTLFISGGLERPRFSSEVAWPHDDYEKFVIDGIADAMYEFANAPIGLDVRLTGVGWHEVYSCGSGFYFAAREAMLSALRIVRVPKAELSPEAEQ
jgi:hypothetical protein